MSLTASAETRPESLVVSLPSVSPCPGPGIVADATVQCQAVQTTLQNPSNVNTVRSVLGGTYGGDLMGEQVKISVSWEEVLPAEGLHPHGELWVRVLSEKPMEPTLDLPEVAASQISPEILGAYNHRTTCNWQADLREDDDETIPEWPYEQWWALPKMRTAG
jgi:hypothetical protein